MDGGIERQHSNRRLRRRAAEFNSTFDRGRKNGKRINGKGKIKTAVRSRRFELDFLILFPLSDCSAVRFFGWHFLKNYA
ncbi:MAG: hypothetical protein ACLUE6_04630 [Acutalibacteraceae bacterium]